MAEPPDPSADELARRLELRNAELAAAHRRSSDLLVTARKHKDLREKYEHTKAERDALRESLEYRFGRKIVLPFRKLWRVFFPTKKAAAKTESSPEKISYHQWLIAQRRKDAELAAMRAEAAQWQPRPRFSLVMPVFNTPLTLLDAAIDSVKAQSYEDWELVIANAASTDAQIRPFLDRAAASEPRIKVTHLAQNSGIAR